MIGSGWGRGRFNVIRDVLTVGLLVAGLLLPWNIGSGVGIPGTAVWVICVMVVVSILSLAAVLLRYVARRNDSHPAHTNRRILPLATPYLVVAVGLVAFTVVQSIRYGGSGAVPPGVGPGAWLGTAGALLAAQPAVTTAADGGQWAVAKAGRTLGIASIVLACAATIFNLYWRTRFVIPNIGVNGQNVVVAVAAVLYAVVALAPVVIAGRWLMSKDQTSRLSVVLLGAATLVGGASVWVLPIGRELDAFHGIAQNTSTAGVGFEGLFAWAAGAALVGTVTLVGLQHAKLGSLAHAVSRRCLLLIAVWCTGSAVLRVADVVSVSVLDLPEPPYGSITLMAFDLVVAVLALWLCANQGARSVVPQSVSMLLLGILFVLTVSRVILGVALPGRVRPLNATDINSVYGNTQVHQIIGTFDVVLCIVALALLAIPFALRIRSVQTPRRGSEPDGVATSSAADDGHIASYSHIASDTDVAAAQPAANDRVAAVLAESTRRFAAGTAYGGATGERKDR